MGGLFSSQNTSPDLQAKRFQEDCKLYPPDEDGNYYEDIVINGIDCYIFRHNFYCACIIPPEDINWSPYMKNISELCHGGFSFWDWSFDCGHDGDYYLGSNGGIFRNHKYVIDNLKQVTAYMAGILDAHAELDENEEEKEKSVDEKPL